MPLNTFNSAKTSTDLFWWWFGGMWHRLTSIKGQISLHRQDQMTKTVTYITVLVILTHIFTIDGVDH